MTKPIFLSSLICLAAGLAIPTARAQSTNKLRFPDAGFSIAPLDSPPGKTPIQPLTMCLPAQDGFAANVNVQIQPFKDGIGTYSSLSVTQLKAAGLKLLQNKSVGKSAAIYEYTGMMQGNLLHYYQRAEKSGDYIYLATATAPDDQWAELGPRLKACVDSCHVDAPAQHSSSPAPPGH